MFFRLLFAGFASSRLCERLLFLVVVVFAAHAFAAEPVGFTVTDGSGRFHLSDGAGQRLRIESIGLAAVVAEIPAAGDLRIEVPSARLRLPASSSGECRDLGAADEAVQMVWTEARKALRVESWARSQHVYSYDVFQYERGLSERERIVSERGRRLENLTEGPARTRPAASRARKPRSAGKAKAR